MSACEACWAEAYLRSRVDGRSQVEHYEALLIERAAHVLVTALSDEES